MGFDKSKADLCLYFKNDPEDGLVVWVSWIDDCLVCGKPEGVAKAKQQMMDHFDCDEVGEMTEYIGCKVEKGDGWLRLTQPILLRSFEDEFELPDGEALKTPTKPGEVLVSVSEEGAMEAGE